MDSQPEFRLLVADDEPSIIKAYEALLSDSPPGANGQSDLDALEDALFGDGGAEPASGTAAPQSYRICSFGQGQDAVNAVRQAKQDGLPYSVAFLDVRMPPGINGIEAARQIRQIDPDINIVIVTGYPDVSPDDIADQVPPPERLFHVAKPFKGPEIEQLLSSLSSQLN